MEKHPKHIPGLELQVFCPRGYHSQENGWHLSQSAQVVVTKYRSLVTSLQSRGLFLSLEARHPRQKCWYLKGPPFWCADVAGSSHGRQRGLWFPPLLIRTLIPSGLHPHSLILSPQASTFNTVTLGIRTSIYEFGGHKHSVQRHYSMVIKITG
jgi:hypothetical protein